MPEKLYKKYHVTKTDGKPTDPKAVYFVLRIDNITQDPAVWDAMMAYIKGKERAGGKGYADELRSWVVRVGTPDSPWLR